ncbi:25790_t:CDS:2, partial [Racocetra persica]
MFIPKLENDEIIDNYLDPIYGLLTDSIEEDSDSSSISNNDNTNKVEYLSLADTTNLIQKVCAAIYLSLDKLWQIPSEISLLATILNPRLKNFPFLKSSDYMQKIQAESLLKNLYNQYKQDMIISNQAEKTIETSLIENEDDDIFTEMWINNRSENIEQTEEEIVRYLNYPDKPKKIDPLEWWQKYKINASNHISSKRTRLSPNL